MKNMKRVAILLIFILTVTSFSGCSKQDSSKTTVTPDSTEKTTDENKDTEKDSETTKDNSEKDSVNKNSEELPEFIIEDTDTTITYLNPMGNKQTITKNPKKVVVLMNSILDIWYLAGGEAIARVSGSTNVPEAAKDIEQVGKVNAPSVEKVLSLEPDLVILSSTRSQHVEMEDILKSNNIECAYVDVSNNPYERFNDALRLFTKITGRDDIYDSEVKTLKENVNKICEKAKKEEQPDVFILFGSTKYVKAELSTGLVGNMIEMLGAKNIITDSPVENSSKVDFSLEKILEKDPDVILVVTMGDLEKVKTRINDDLESNEAWATLTAVKEGNVHYLPSDLFHYKPNARYPEAFEYLAKILYPQVFK
ncbi:ABC transporter substrate-binding protein [Vallitalea guaymasensis]|uniref:ABC transporter substrate-binding protein n=1 Tax=Vallitalea guaymasensis TaxID=1185412 RepID=UPI0023531BA0|nr:ABC transporter substrate-binding protein [Vallitalea guaymasensis]